jgi:hypothetical protein
MERGETEGATKTWEALKSENGEWLHDRKLNILVQYALHKAPDLDAPLMLDLGRTEADREVLKFFTAGNELGRAFMTTPEVPPERAAALRKAFMDMMQDPAFLEEARQRKLEFGPLPGEEVQKLIDSTLGVSPAILAAAKKARDG